MKRLLLEHESARLGDVNCFPLSMSLCRIGIFSTVLVLLDGVGAWDAFLKHAAERTFTPKGPAGLLGEWARSPEFMSGLARLAWWSTGAAVLGFFSRVSQPLSVVSSCLVFGVLEGYTAYWSHGRNVCLVAAIPFAFAHGTGYLSLDKLIDRALTRVASLRWWSILYGERQQMWPILLAQFSVAFMFFDAAFHKLREGGWKFAWILSDNLRNLLAKKFLVWNQNLDMPSIVDFLMRHEVAWKLAAFGAVFFQLSCMVCVVFPRYPWLRVYSAMSYLSVLAGLNGVMMMGNWSRRLPLLVVFIHFEYFLARWRSGGRSRRAAVLLPAVSVPRRSLRRLFVFAFVGYSIYVGATPHHKELTATYPFTAYDPYSVPLAHRPVLEHQDYVFPEWYYAGLQPRDGRYEDVELFRDARVRGAVRAVGQGRSVAAVSGAFRQLFQRMERYRVRERRVDLDEVALIAVYEAELYIPAYPQAPEPRVRRKALIAVGDRAGVVLSASCKTRIVGEEIVGVEVRPLGYEQVRLQASVTRKDGVVRFVETSPRDWGLELAEPFKKTRDAFQLRVHVTEEGDTPYRGVEWVYHSQHLVRGELVVAGE